MTQSSKGRKRKKKNVNVVEKWDKKNVDRNRRSIYFNIIDKFASKRARSKTEDQSYSVTKKISESDESATVSSSNEQISASDDTEDNTSLNETKSASENTSTVSSKSSLDVRMNLDKSTTDNDGSSKASSEFNFGTNLVPPLKKALRHSSNEPKVTNDQSPKNTSCQLSPQSETIIDGYTIQW
ncbi:unnamed protein product, partial [Didymodactylos carnosus]